MHWQGFIAVVVVPLIVIVIHGHLSLHVDIVDLIQIINLIHSLVLVVRIVSVACLILLLIVELRMNKLSHTECKVESMIDGLKCRSIEILI